MTDREKIARALFGDYWERLTDNSPGMEAVWRDTCDLYLHNADIALAALGLGPDGDMVRTPKEPTEAQLIAARDWSIAKNGRGVGNDQATGCYRAMLAPHARR